ncbi:unnamed protein product [Chrysoparadoxa australica]
MAALTSMISTLLAVLVPKASYSKWSFKRSGPTRPLEDDLLQRVTTILQASEERFELPTVTRYQVGGHQKRHVDVYPSDDLERLADAGGQRLANCLVYLAGDDCKGGRTVFHDSSMNGLKVTPQKGSAIIFFPAFQDGSPDQRMMHSGETVEAGEKWIVNSWLLQTKPSRVFAQQEALVGGEGEQASDSVRVR